MVAKNRNGVSMRQTQPVVWTPFVWDEFEALEQLVKLHGVGHGERPLTASHRARKRRPEPFSNDAMYIDMESLA
jgi:hypothetical protein